MKIAIASGKGGTGKTTLSTNLASYMAEYGEVVLTDLDVEEPNSGLFIHGTKIHEENKFKMVPQWNQHTCDSCGSCQEICNFHAIIHLSDQVLVFPELCHSCYACSELCPTSSLPMISQSIGMLKHYHSGKLHFVEGRLNIGQEQATPLIMQTKEYVNGKFTDNIIKLYDSPPGTSCPVIEATKDVNFVILVTEPTPFGLHDLKLAIATMLRLGKTFAVVVNRFGIGNNDVLEYCREMNTPVLAKIPVDRRIAELCSRGELIYQSIPGIREQLDNIITYITGLKKRDEE